MPAAAARAQAPVHGLTLPHPRIGRTVRCDGSHSVGGSDRRATRFDLASRRRTVSRAWAAAVAGHPEQAFDVGDEVLDSWGRSSDWVDPRCTGAPVDDPDEVVRSWEATPAAAGVHATADQVRDVVAEGDLIAAVTDAAGRIVWTCGSRVMRRAAERINFVPGGRWDEASVGTNALALALRTGRPSTVYSAEHFSQAVHGWVCHSVPLTDPATGDVLGVLDLSTTWDRAHPLAMSAARSLGRSVTSQLPRQRAPELVLRGLGDAEARLAGAPLALTRRRSEIVLLLALHPDGLTLGQLHDRLYGDAHVTASTLKAEVSHLRTLLGGAIGSRPYRLTSPVSTDVHRVLDALGRGDVDAAVAYYGGLLLPASESPGVAEWREYVDVALRDAVLGSRDVAPVLAFADRHPYDSQLQEHLVDVLPAEDPRRSLARARVARAQA